MATNTGKVSEFFDFDALAKEISQVDKTISAAYDELAKKTIPISTAGNAVRGSSGVAEQTTAQNAANKATQDAIDLTGKLTAAEISNAKAKAERTARMKEANDQAKAEVALAKVANDSMIANDILIKQKTDQYAALSKAQRDNSTGLRDEIKALQDQQRELKMATGDMKSNVGAYTESINKSNIFSQALQNLKGHFDEGTQHAGSMRESVRSLKEVVTSIPGPIGQVGSAITELGGMLRMGMVGLAIAALTATIWAVTKAVELWKERNDDLYASNIKLLNSLIQLRAKFNEYHQDFLDATDKRTEREKKYSVIYAEELKKRADSDKEYDQSWQVIENNFKLGKIDEDQKLAAFHEVQKQRDTEYQEAHAAANAKIDKVDTDLAKKQQDIADNYKNAIQKVDEELAKLKDLLIDEVANADHKNLIDTRNKIDSLETYKTRLQELITVLQNPALQYPNYQPGFHAEQRTATSVTTGAEASNIPVPSKVENKMPDFTAEPMSDAELQVSADKKAWEERLNIAKSAVSKIQSLVNQFYEDELKQIDETKQATDDKYQAEYDAADGNSKKQTEIKKEQAAEDAALDKQKRKIVHDQAVLNKALGAVQIIVNTAVGAMAQTSVPIVGEAMAALTIALGAVELALVLAEPVPAARHGIKNAPGGIMRVSEEGQEGLLHKGKLSLLPERESLAYIPEGASVLTHNELLDVAGRASLGGVEGYPGFLMNQKQDNTDLLQSNRELINVIKNKREVHLNFDKHGFSVAAHNGAVWEKYLDDRVRL